MTGKPVSKTTLLSLLCLLLATALTHAEPKTFVNAGLKHELVVKLDVAGKTAHGTFLSTEYDRAGGKPVPFTGKVLPTPKGKPGVKLEIQFDAASGKDAPYAVPAGEERIVWTLRIVNKHAHLFIPMSERNYETVPAKWVVTEVEFEPER